MSRFWIRIPGQSLYCGITRRNLRLTQNAAVQLSDPLLQLDLMVVVNPEEFSTAGNEEFSLIVTDNTAVNSEFLSQMPSGQILYADTLVQCLLAVADHKAAATVCDSYTLNYYSWKPGISDLRIIIRWNSRRCSPVLRPAPILIRC